MKYLIKALKILGKTVVGFLVFGWCYVMAVGIGQAIVANAEYPLQNAEITCYVQNSGVHTDIIVPVITKSYNWNTILPPTDFEAGASDAQFIGFGWGDRGFFMETPTWDELEASTALSAMFWPSESVMHAFYEKSAPKLGPMVQEIKLTQEQYSKLVGFIRESFHETSANPTALTVAGDYYAANDRFYLGEGSYFFTYTCNVWTNQALKSCGVRTPAWSPFPEAIMNELSPQP
jgi:uncharacterized protein (TIGR02117 family)